MRGLIFILLSWLAVSKMEAASHAEDFTADPFTQGWQIFGDTNLFQWDASNERVNVTWDSSQTNSYFYRPLGTTLAKADDFSLMFEVRLTDIAIGVNPAKPNTFEISVGFLNLANATQTNFIRGTGTQSPNIVEFDYFPDSGFGATIAPAIVSNNRQFASSFTFPYEMVPEVLYHITMTYTASNQTLNTVMTANGEPTIAIKPVKLGSTFTDFRVDTVAISSYSDTNSSGSILAHGYVDDLEVTLPPPPVENISLMLLENGSQISWSGRAGWRYALERTTDFTIFETVNELITSTNAILHLSDTNSPIDQAFYRLRATRP